MDIIAQTGDCVELTRALPDNSIHLVVTSPPYDNLRTYQSCTWDFPKLAEQLHRVLVPGGVVCWIVGDAVVDGSETLSAFRQAIHFKDVCGLRIHDTMIYEKRNFSHPDRTRYHQIFEFMFVLSKGRPRCFNPIRDKKNLTAGCVGNLGVNTFTERDGSKSVRAKKVTAEFGMRHNVWKGNTRGQEDMCKVLTHPAMMPRWVARDHITSWSNPGDTVLDPFAGSFTTIQEAVKLGRHAIGFDICEDYVSQYKSTRCQQPQHLR